MQQPPFPIVLVVLVALFGFLALTSGPVWIRILAGIATAIVVAAAIYQARPRRPDVEPFDDQPDIDPS